MKSKLIGFLISLAIAFGLWAYVITVVSPGYEETYYNVPVVLQNEGLLKERGLMVTAVENPTITLRLSGNRTDLINLNSSNITVIADLSKIYEARKHSLRYDISYPGNVSDSAITPLTQEPDSITLIVEDRISKSVEVLIEYTGALAEGYICDKENAVLDSEFITVTGPKSQIDRIDHARIKVNLDDKRTSISEQFAYMLCNEDGEPVENVDLVETSVEVVTLSLKIQKLKEIALLVTVVDGGGATTQTSSIVVTPEKIQISGNDNQLENINELNLGTINLGELLKDQTLTFPIILPEGINNETGVTEATVDVKFPSLLTRKFSVTNIQAVNIPEGMEVDLITQQLEISVRGPRALVTAMKETDIMVTIDFADAQMGTATMKPKIIMGGNYADVGAVGSYTVVATLREPLDEDAQKKAG